MSKNEMDDLEQAANASPVALARRFVEEHCTHTDGPMLRRWRGDYYQWNAARGSYVQATDDQLQSALYRALGLRDRKLVADVAHALLAVDDVLIDGHDLGSWLGAPTIDSDPLDVVTAPNGLVDLTSGAIVPATPRYFSTTSLGVAYDPSAAPPTKWLEFLHQLWPHDDQAIAALQEWFGYMLTPDTRQQKILLLVGPKRSGKGTIARVQTALLGRESVAAPTLASLGTNFGLWPLIGRSAAIVGDARLGGRSDVAQIVERLLSVSGQDPQTIDRKHREPWTGFLSARIALVSNELPRFADASGALASRMLLLQTASSFFGREDTRLTDTLLGELPGILNWSIAGWQRLRAQGRFTVPASSAALADELADLASPVAAWLNERTDRTSSGAVACEAAYRSYRTWASAHGHHEISQETFGRDVRAASGCERRQIKRAWHYIGIALRSAGAEVPIRQCAHLLCRPGLPCSRSTAN